MSRAWYAVQCKPREDDRAEVNLERQGFEVYRPRALVRKRRRGAVVKVEESLFPRYLFLNLEAGVDNWYPIRSTRGVVGLVRFGLDPTPVPDSVIEFIKNHTDAATGCVDLVTPYDYQQGQTVLISEGPFAGYEAVFLRRTGEERVLVLLEVMKQNQQLLLPESAIQ
jgi:transcriptional antiterminator RfaH